MSAGNSLNSSSLGNVLFGESAGAGITSADYNTFVGHNAGRFYGHAAAQRNTAIGFQSMYVGGNASTNSAYDNTAVGYQSLRLVTTGIENTAIGTSSVPRLSPSSLLVALGMDTGFSPSTGNDTVFIGTSSFGPSLSGDDICLICSSAGFSLLHDTDNDGGFFMACMPVSEVPQNGAIGFLVHEEFRYKQDRVTEVINQFKITKLGNGYVLISTFCTPDRAWQHFTEIADTMRYAFVGYSTPSQIAPLAEDRELCLALSKGKNHNIKAEVA